MTPQEIYDRMVDELRAEPNVGEGRMFSATGLTYKRKFFVARMPSGELLLKLPASRVDELVADELGERFDRGDGRPLREWATVPPSETHRWPDLAHEALAFAHVLHGAVSG